MLCSLHKIAAIFLQLPWERYEVISSESCKPCEEDMMKSANHSHLPTKITVQLCVGPQAEVDAGQPLCNSKTLADGEISSGSSSPTQSHQLPQQLLGLKESRSVAFKIKAY